MRLIKIVAAFVGGVGLALGTALVFLHITGTQLRETVRDNPVLETPPPVVSSPAPVPASLPVAGPTAVPATPVDHAAKPDQASKPVVNSAKDAEVRPESGTGTRTSSRSAPSTATVLRGSLSSLEPVKPVQPRKAVPVVTRTRATVKPQPDKNAPVEIAQNHIPEPPAQPVVNPAPVPAQSSPTPAPVIAAPVPAPEPVPVPPSSAPVRREPRTVTLAPGTLLVIRMGETVSTEENYSGDTFRATLDQPVIIGSAIIADRGSKVLGRIVTAQRAGRVQGVSDLSLTLVEINTTDGQRVPIHSTAFNQQGQTGRGTDVAKVGGGAALGAIIGAVAGGGKGAGIGAGVGGAAGAGDVLLTRGKPAIIQNEAKLRFSLAQPVTITERLNY